MDQVAGHSSIEDSTASLKLTKLKLSRDIYFGDYALTMKKNVEEKKSYTGIVNSGDSNPMPGVATTLFSQAFHRRKKSAIITTHNSDIDLGKFYSKSQFELIQSGDDDEDKSHGIVHHKERTAKQVIEKTQEVINDNDFNLLHFNIMEDAMTDNDPDVSPDEKVTALIPKIDKWIEKIWNSVSKNGLFVVLFGGHESNSSGVSMVNIKK